MESFTLLLPVPVLVHSLTTTPDATDFQGLVYQNIPHDVQLLAQNAKCGKLCR